MYIYSIDPKSKKCVFLGYSKGVKGFKLWDPIKRKMLINIYVVVYEQLMLKRTNATNVSISKGETSNK